MEKSARHSKTTARDKVGFSSIAEIEDAVFCEIAFFALVSPGYFPRLSNHHASHYLFDCSRSD
jgi:hypothetical protein